MSEPARFDPNAAAGTATILAASALLALGGGAAAFPQPPSVDLEVDEALAAAGTASEPAELEAARATLLELSRRYSRPLYPRFAGRSRALVEAASLGRRLGESGTAAGELLEILEREAPNEWTPRAHLELADLVLADGDWLLAADHYWQARQAALGGAASDAEAPGAIDVAGLALERMTRIHRLILRPLAGGPSWSSISLPLPGGYLPEKQQLKRPRSLAAGPRGELIVADDSRFVLFDPQGNVVSTRELRALARPSIGPAGPLGGVGPVAVAANAALRVGDPVPVSFERPSGGRLGQIITAYRDPFGNWTVLSRQTDVVLRYDPAGKLLDFAAVPMTRPVDLAVSPSSDVHVLDAGSGAAAPAVLRFSADGQLQHTFSANWRRPVALDVDPLGNTYVLENREKQILVYDPEGNRIAVLGPVLSANIELRSPNDIAVDGMGRIFIAEGRLETVVALD